VLFRGSLGGERWEKRAVAKREVYGKRRKGAGRIKRRTTSRGPRRRKRIARKTTGGEEGEARLKAKTSPKWTVSGPNEVGAEEGNSRRGGRGTCKK